MKRKRADDWTRPRKPTPRGASIRQRQQERRDLAKVLANQLRSYIIELGGAREAARQAGLAAGTIYGWMGPRGKQNLPTVLQLLKLARLRDRSLDSLVGRDVPETLGLSRTRAELAADLHTYVREALERDRIQTVQTEYRSESGQERAVFLPEPDQLLAWVVQEARPFVLQRAAAWRAGVEWIGQQAEKRRGRRSTTGGIRGK